ncbi:unnamed protein product [Lathyrus sativus]|nr:unnamed protein product [Lathyrus sativus]
MKFYVLVLVFFAVFAATRPCFVSSRILQSPTKTEKTSHEPIKDVQHLKASMTTEKINTEYTMMKNRILVDSQFHTMTSGPSRRGSGH